MIFSRKYKRLLKVVVIPFLINFFIVFIYGCAVSLLLHGGFL